MSGVSNLGHHMAACLTTLWVRSLALDEAASMQSITKLSVHKALERMGSFSFQIPPQIVPPNFSKAVPSKGSNKYCCQIQANLAHSHGVRFRH